MSTELVENDHILDEVKVEVGALLFCPLLSDMIEKDCLATVQIKPKDAINAHRRLVHEAGDTSLLKILLQQKEHVGVV